MSSWIILIIGTFDPLRVAHHVWVATLKDIFQPGLCPRKWQAYAFKPPGWSHDGSRKTSDQIKADHAP